MMKFRAFVMVFMVAMGMLVGNSAASFKDCYAKCFIFCMIEPSQTLCSCSTHCLKDCIFSDTPGGLLQEDKLITHNHNFCKLGCAFSTCSKITTTANNPNVDKMDGCVGSCATMCTKTYSAAP
ncbi:OLC1v1014719C1 [Oldenlandia corymbosa var. corymbosa]|uniref:OLC1v1014719C1 n=1 Tax=Oldenlandia corymbosa var. corymbosa TaxID=529605 RepID=A0AAV1E4Z5_OLDCO|nr:OLC1v1014719C1 [Oldenlandia corymbosa var. corymbosa]